MAAALFLLLASSVLSPSLAAPLFADGAASILQDLRPITNAGAHPAITSTIPSGSLSNSTLPSNSSTGGSPNTTVRANTTRADRCTKSGTWALTLDDGVQPNENRIVDLFERRNVTGTFFVNGYNWGCIYSEDSVRTLRATYAAGMEIGSHTWGHIHGGLATPEVFNHQLALVEEALIKILGIKPALYRPPYGEITDANMEVLRSRGYAAALLWNYDSGDGRGIGPQESIAGFRRMAQTYPAPGMSLDHEQTGTTIEMVLPAAIDALGGAGYDLVSVSDCLGIEAYQWVGEPQERDATWTCSGRPSPGQLA